MPLIFYFRRISSRHVLSLTFFIFALAGIGPGPAVAAQQPESDNPPPIVTSTPANLMLAVSTPDSDSQAAPQSPSPQSAIDPSAPQTQRAQGAEQDATGQQTKRILGIIPNFRAVSADTKLPPQSVKEKFMDATEDSFDYSSIFIPAIIAGYNMYEKTTPQFHQGAPGYARYFWHSAVDQTSENYMVEFIFPVVTREDGRYYTLGRGGFLKRTGYALSRAVITRTDSGGESFNISEVFGAGAASGISNLYYPSASRSVGNTMSEWAEDVGIDAASFWVREFWPDINRHIFHNKYSDAPVNK
jgi:hypothetical protein